METNMRMPPLVAGLLSIGLLLSSPGSACAQATSTGAGQIQPGRPIRVVTGDPGGGSDLAARLIAQGLTISLGQQVIVENRGGSVIIPARIVAQAPADGHTLLLYSDSIWILPLMQDHVPFDPVQSFSPVTLPGRSPTVLVVHPSLPARSVAELIALVRSRPGELNYSSGAAGGVNHLSPELFKAMAGVNITRIAYKGAVAALNDLIAGQVQLMFPAVASGMPHVKSGRLMALAVTSAQPTALAPGLPTVAASGLPGYESTLILGVLAPAKTPVTVVSRLNQEIVQVLYREEVKERFFNAGIEVVASTPEQLAASVKSGMAKWGKLIRDAGIRGD